MKIYPMNKSITSNKLKDIMLAIKKQDFSLALNMADKLLAINNTNIDVLYLKSIALLQSSQNSLARESLIQLLKINPNHLDSLIDLAQLESDDNNHSKALVLAKQASKLDPKNLEIKFFLIGIYIKTEEYEKARKLIHEILSIQTKNDSALYLMAFSYFKEKKYQEGSKYALEALKINPNLTNLRILLSEYYGRYELNYSLALKLLEEEIKLNPRSNEAYKFIGNYLGKLGEIDQAIEFTKQQIKLNPDSISAHSNLMFFLPYSPNISNQEILESANEFYQKCLSNNSSRTQSFLNTKDPNKKLRIGFVSGDFRNHALVFWLKGFFEKLKSHNIDVYCYCNNLEDEITKLWKLETKKWRNILNLDDQTAFELIQNDEIDILVDLSGHTEHNRLGIFSYKPAPIQITWLGQSGPMGLPQIDYMISDSYMVKAEEEKFYTEKILRLPNIYAPYSNQVNIELNSAPCLKNKFITFGCLNNFVKINSKVITTWIRILQQIENSRLILKSHIFSDMDIKNRLIENFAKHDIAENRLRLEPFDLNRENYLKTYLDIDIALDPFPFGGGTTTHDLILMGIPLITLYGQRLSNRSSASILYHIGCSELICYSLDEYIKKTLELAQDYELVNHYRTVLRDKYLSSPLNDLETFAKNFSNTLKAIWQKYCLEGIIKQ